MIFLLLETETLIRTKCVVLTTGTFLNGEMYSGMTVKPGGRINSKPSIGLANTLKRLGFNTGRMKTGTPPWIEKQSINFTNLNYQPGDDLPTPFSFMNHSVWLKVKKYVITLFIIIYCFCFVILLFFLAWRPNKKLSDVYKQ